MTNQINHAHEFTSYILLKFYQTLLHCRITKCLRQPKIKVGNQTQSQGFYIQNGYPLRKKSQTV